MRKPLPFLRRWSCWFLSSALALLGSCASNDGSDTGADGAAPDGEQFVPDQDARSETAEPSDDSRTGDAGTAILDALTEHSQAPSDSGEGETSIEPEDAANTGDVTPSPVLDPMADIRMLAGGELALFCDLVNETLGGYGLTTDCSGGNTVSNHDDRDACTAIGFHPRCRVTVEQYRTCLDAQAPSHGCERPYEFCHALSCQ